MVARTASDKDDPARPPNDAQVGRQPSQRDPARIEVDASSHRVDDRFRLFVDLLLHEMIERALHDGGQFDLERLDGTNSRDAVVFSQSVDVELALGDMSDVVVFEVENPLGVLDCAFRSTRGPSREHPGAPMAEASLATKNSIG